MKRLIVVCLSAVLASSMAPDAFGWGAVHGAYGGAAYRGPMGGTAVRGPGGAAAYRGPAGGAAVRGPYGGAAARGPYGGTAYRAPGGAYYGGAYRGPTTVYRGGTYYGGTAVGVGAGVAAGVAVGAAAGAAAASSAYYYPPPPYYQPPPLLRTLPKVAIAMVNGPAIGAGLGLAMACDLRIAGRSARFGTGFAGVGYSGDFGGSWSLTRLVGTAKARELYFLGDIIDATEAASIGLLNHVVEDDGLHDTTMVLARRIGDWPGL